MVLGHSGIRDNGPAVHDLRRRNDSGFSFARRRASQSPPIAGCVGPGRQRANHESDNQADSDRELPVLRRDQVGGEEEGGRQTQTLRDASTAKPGRAASGEGRLEN